ERSLDSVVSHPANGVAQIGVPVAVAPVDREVRSVAGKLVRQSGGQSPVLAVERAHASEGPVVLGDLLDPVGRYRAAPEDIVEEGEHVVVALGPAEGQDNDGVVG